MMRSIIVAFFATATLIATGPGASVGAHARLDRAEPAPEAATSEMPVEVRIWFSQELTLSGNELYVADADGNRVDNDDAQVDQSDPNRKQLVVTLPALEPGAYTVHYTSSSADDGHPYSDSYTFTLEAASEVVPDCARLEA